MEYTDCVMHYKAWCLWVHPRGERQRNLAASIRGLARERKKMVQEERGKGSNGVGVGGWGAAKDM